MKITEVKVRKFENRKENSRYLGTASVILDDCFVIKGIRIKECENGLRLAMPSRLGSDGEQHDMAHPINQETREMFEKAVLEEFEKAE